MDIIKSDIVALHGIGISMQGGRPENQDDWGFLDTPLGCLVIICDGMGGGPGGKTASYIVKHEIASTLCECPMQTPRDHALKMAVARANEALESKMHEVPTLSGMGSTFVAVLINRESAMIAHAGDSRCYKIRGKKCLYRSEDHSLVAELVKKKALSEEEARLSPQANVIFRGLGSTTNHVPEIEEVPFKRGDRFVLCTDGVWGSMPQTTLLDKLSANSDIRSISTNLAAEIDQIGYSKGGGHDNHTLAIFDMEIDSLLKENRKNLRWRLVGLSVFFLVFILGLVIVLISNNKNNTNSGQKEGSPVVSEIDTSPTIHKTSTTTPQNPAVVTPTENDPEETLSQNSSDKNDAVPLTTDSLQKIVSNMIEEKRQQEADSTLNQQRGVSKGKKDTLSTPSDIIDNIIDNYVRAKGVKANTQKDAVKKLELLHEEIKASLKKLQSKVNSDCVNKVVAIEKGADNPDLSRVMKDEKSQPEMYVPAVKTLKEINKQVSLLKELKKRIDGE